ncbi:MAG: hypothetical protein J0M15_07655 [Deltaproteobacteria bacterium]|nr:hypothetical protein [Deltaproteobacteria bacterium]
MSIFKTSLRILFFLSSLSLSIFAEEVSKEDSTKENPLRCERFTKSNLRDLKEKLYENCDLNKPFSTSLAINIGEEHFLYCCHKKK